MSSLWLSYKFLCLLHCRGYKFVVPAAGAAGVAGVPYATDWAPFAFVVVVMRDYTALCVLALGTRVSLSLPTRTASAAARVVALPIYYNSMSDKFIEYSSFTWYLSHGEFTVVTTCVIHNRWWACIVRLPDGNNSNYPLWPQISSCVARWPTMGTDAIIGTKVWRQCQRFAQIMSTDNTRKMSQSTDEAVRPVSANPSLPSRHLPYSTQPSRDSYSDWLCMLVWSARNGGPHGLLDKRNGNALERKANK